MKNYPDLKFKILFVLIFSFSLFAFRFSLAETDQEKINRLQQQIEALEHQAEQLRHSIAETQEEAQSIQQQLNAINTQVRAIQLEIDRTAAQINKTSTQISNVQSNISTTQSKIEYQKSSLAQLLLDMQKRDEENLLMILFKNRNLSDFFQQAHYTATLNSTLVNTVEELKDTKHDLAEQKTDLESRKRELEFLRQQQSAQKTILANAQNEQKKLLTETKGQEAQYQKILADVERQKNVFFTQMREIETKIIQGGLYIVHVTATAVPKKGTKLFQSPERGYRLTQGYGCTRYARCKRSSGPYGGAPHNGIDIAAGYGKEIMAIGDGEIIANGRNDGWGNWVAIKHPNQYNFVSVYGHMSALSFLQVGTAVRVGQVIGYEGNTGNATGSHLHLSLYKDFFTYEKNGQLYFNYFDGTVNPLDYL